MSSNNTKFGQYFWLAFWVMLIILFSYIFTIKQEHSEIVNITPQHIKIMATQNGHFLIVGKINNHPVKYLVDTGATNVVIPEQLANKIGLSKGPEVRVSTANGTIGVYLTRIDKLEIATIKLNNIRANINPYMKGDEVLLGMSALKKLELRQQSEELQLIQN